MDQISQICKPCRGDVPPLGPDEVARRHAHIPHWEVTAAGTVLKRTYKLKNFRDAFGFVAALSDEAEVQGHHPDICFGWGYVTVSLQTHKIKGLHDNDFIMAARFDRLAADRGVP